MTNSEWSHFPSQEAHVLFLLPYSSLNSTHSQTRGARLRAGCSHVCTLESGEVSQAAGKELPSSTWFISWASPAFWRCWQLDP